MNSTVIGAMQSSTIHRALAAAARALAGLPAALAQGLQASRRARIARLELAAMTSHEARDVGIDTATARFGASGGFIHR